MLWKFTHLLRLVARYTPIVYLHLTFVPSQIATIVLIVFQVFTSDFLKGMWYTMLLKRAGLLKY